MMAQNGNAGYREIVLDLFVRLYMQLLSSLSLGVLVYSNNSITALP